MGKGEVRCGGVEHRRAAHGVQSPAVCSDRGSARETESHGERRNAEGNRSVIISVLYYCPQSNCIRVKHFSLPGWWVGKYQVEKCKSSFVCGVSFWQPLIVLFCLLNQMYLFVICIGDDPSYDGLCWSFARGACSTAHVCRGHDRGAARICCEFSALAQNDLRCRNDWSYCLTVKINSCGNSCKTIFLIFHLFRWSCLVDWQIWATLATWTQQCSVCVLCLSLKLLSGGTYWAYPTFKVVVNIKLFLV